MPPPKESVFKTTNNQIKKFNCKKIEIIILIANHTKETVLLKESLTELMSCILEKTVEFLMYVYPSICQLMFSRVDVCIS